MEYVKRLSKDLTVKGRKVKSKCNRAVTLHRTYAFCTIACEIGHSAVVYYGLGQGALEQREKIKLRTLAARCQVHFDQQKLLINRMG